MYFPFYFIKKFEPNSEFKVKGMTSLGGNFNFSGDNIPSISSSVWCWLNNILLNNTCSCLIFNWSWDLEARIICLILIKSNTDDK